MTIFVIVMNSPFFLDSALFTFFIFSDQSSRIFFHWLLFSLPSPRFAARTGSFFLIFLREMVLMDKFEKSKYMLTTPPTRYKDHHHQNKYRQGRVIAKKKMVGNFFYTHKGRANLWHNILTIVFAVDVNWQLNDEDSCLSFLSFLFFQVSTLHIATGG